MSQAKANCKFCSKTDNSIQVICETRCLICSRCQLMPGIRKLLLDHTNANNVPSDFPISCGNCPLCDAAMSPSMLILITTFRDAFKKLQADENFQGRLGSEIELEEINNLFANFLKRFRNTYETDDSKDAIQTSGPQTATKRYNATVVDIYETYAAPTKANAQMALEFIVDCFYAQWMGIIRNNNENMVSIFMRMTNKKKFSIKTNDFKAKALIDFMTSSGGYETQDILLFGRILGLQPKMTSNISAAWSHIAVAIQVASHCDRCLKYGQLNDGQGNPSATELRQKMVKNTYNPKVISLKKAVRIIALLSQVKHPHWTMSPLSPACIEFNCQYPWSPESISKLLNILFYVTLYDPALPPPPSSPGMGSRRASALPPLASQHNLLAEIQQQQAVLQSQESFLTQPPTAAEVAMSAAIMAAYKTNARVGMLRNLESVVKRMWGASANSNMSKSTNKAELLHYFNRIDQQRSHAHYARMTYEKAMSLIDNQTILVSELVLLCIECWDCEYARIKLNISKGKITSQRRMAIGGKYDSTMANCTAVERLAIIRLLHWYSHEGESRGVDWEDVEVNYKDRAFPFLVPDSLMEKSRNELNYLSEKLWAGIVAQQQKDRAEDLLAESGPYATNAKGVRTFGNSQMIYGNAMNADDYVSYEDIARYNREQYLAAQSLGYGPEEFEGWVDEDTLPKDEVIVRGGKGGEQGSYEVDTPSQPHHTHHHHHHHHHGSGHHHHHHSGHHHHSHHEDGGEAQLIAESDAVERDSEEILQRAAQSSSRLPTAASGGEGRPKTPLSGLPYESPQPGAHTINMVDMLDVGTSALTNAKLIENSFENQAQHRAAAAAGQAVHYASGVSITSVEERVNNMEIQDLTKGRAYSRENTAEARARREQQQLKEDQEVDEMYEKGQIDHARSKILAARTKIRHRISGRDSTVSLSISIDADAAVQQMHSPDKLAAASATLDAASIASSTTQLTADNDNFASFTHYNAAEYSHCRVNGMIDLSHLVDKNGVFEMDLASTLSCENAVKYLRLRCTRIAAKSFQKVVDHFLKTWQLDKLIRLDLNDNLTLATAGARVLSSKLGACCRLIHLNVSNCNIGDIGFRSLMSAVLNGGGMSCLLRLDLSGNGVTMVSDSFAVIGKFFNLRALDLSHNKITLDTRAQGQLFLQSMSQLTQLEALSLSYNKIQNDGFSLVSSLVTNHFQHNLRILDIASCFITSKSFTGLLKLLNACGEPPEDSAEQPDRQKLRLEEVLFQDNMLSYAQLQELIGSFAKRVGIRVSLNKPHLGIKYPLCYDMKEYGLDEYHV